MQALTGLRVLELATGVAGPYCGKLLAGLGADVVKLEPPGGDGTRQAGPFPGDRADPERSGMFLHLNTAKRSVARRESAPGWRQELHGWLEGADVVISSLRPADLRHAGIDFEEWQRRWPQLVIVSVTGFGLTGPYADYRGGELIHYALGGYMMLTGAPEREPIKSYGEVVQYETGAHAALGALSAVRAREFTGRGQVVDVSAMEAATFLLGGVEQAAYFYGRVARRNGTRLLGFPPEHSYPSTIRPCKDGYVHCHSNNRHLDLLGAMIPSPRLLEPELLHAMLGHAEEIDAIMDPWLAERGRVEVVAEAQALRLPFTEVMQPGEVLADPHHAARGSFVTIEHPGAGPVTQPGAPFRMSATPWVPGPASTLGQHDHSGWKPHATNGRPVATGPKPLSGVRVIDFTNAVAGPIASFILADLGAEVIKVEAPNARPRVAAGTAPLREGAEDLGYNRMMLYNELNHGKLGISLDVARREGRDLFLQLAARSDVVVQNFAPRVMGNLGLDYGALRAVNQRIILVSMPAFGLDGPYRDRIAYGPGIDAMSGLSHLTGYQDGPPMKPGNFFCDQNAGVHAAFATLAALGHRDRTGEGQHVELAMIEGEFQVLGDAYIDWTMNGRERMRAGNAHASMAPHDVYRCQGNDAWVAIAVEDKQQWRSLCRVIGAGGLVADPRFATAGLRVEHAADLRGRIEAWTSVRTHYEAQHAFQTAGVPAAAVLDARELLADPHVIARDGFEYVEAPGVGPTPYPRVAFKLSGTPTPISKAAPGFAEDNDYVLRKLLGMPAKQVESLEAAGITSRVPLGSGH
jgi:crotonobetainyl-CoA:carnitine CoA-transferase CaiB-like acyl-CoA transferase